LDGTCVTDAGIAGLECIITLTSLSLVDCKFITSVSSLRHSPSLRQLDIADPVVTAAGTTGLDEIGKLQCLKACGRTPLHCLDNIVSFAKVCHAKVGPGSRHIPTRRRWTGQSQRTT
jgi:hypothetical protein